MGSGFSRTTGRVKVSILTGNFGKPHHKPSPPPQEDAPSSSCTPPTPADPPTTVEPLAPPSRPTPLATSENVTPREYLPSESSGSRSPQRLRAEDSCTSQSSWAGRSHGSSGTQSPVNARSHGGSSNQSPACGRQLASSKSTPIIRTNSDGTISPLSKLLSSEELLCSIKNTIEEEVRADIYARREMSVKQLKVGEACAPEEKFDLTRKATFRGKYTTAGTGFVSWADANAPRPSEKLFVSWAEPSWASRSSSSADFAKTGAEGSPPKAKATQEGEGSEQPPLSHKYAVGAFFSSVSVLLDARREKNTKKRRLRQASMKELKAVRALERQSRLSGKLTGMLDFIDERKRREGSNRSDTCNARANDYIVDPDCDPPKGQLPSPTMKAVDEEFSLRDAPVVPPPVVSQTSSHIKLRDMARVAIIKPRRHLSMKRSYNDMKIRRIRIFLSSTFADMQDERQLIMTTQVPQLRRACLENGIHVTVVDLRLGVTEGDQLAKRTLGICLDLVASSEYFVNILGERYGWVPRVDDVDAKTLHDHLWIEPYLGKTSATEFEVLAGALGWGSSSKIQTRQAFFYARDPSYIETLPATQQADFLETNEKSEKSLVALKDSIRRRAEGEPWPGQQLPTLAANRTYKEPVELANFFYSDMLEAINTNSPWKQLEPPTPLMTEYVQHISHAWGLDVAYVGQISIQSAIERYVKGEGRRGIPLVLVGERASGKSAAVAHWLLNNRAPGFVLPHFVGCFFNSADHNWIMRRIMLELKVAFDLSGDVPLDSQELQEMLPGWLQRVCRGTTETVTILIDGVDQLADPAARTMRWLPSRVPPNCNIILTTLDGDLRSCTLRGWTNIVQLPPLQDTYKGLFIRAYMKHYGKNIDASVVSMIERAGGSYNPLFLRLCLDELMMQANYATVKDVAKELVSCATLPELCQLILMRFENVFGEPLVSTALQCICMSRYGLSEEELLLLLQMLLPTAEVKSSENNPGKKSLKSLRHKVLPSFTPFAIGISKWQQAVRTAQLPWLSWAPFYKAALGLLSTNGGLVDISCVSFRHAAMERYLGDEESITEVHCALAHFFSNADPNVVEHSRLCEELPYQLMRSGQNGSLEAFCLDMRHFEQMWTRRRYDVYTYWRRIGEGKIPEMVGGLYCDAVARQAGDWWQKSRSDLLNKDLRARTERIATTCGMISEFLCTVSCFREAAQMQRHSLQVTQLLYHKDNRRIARTLCSLAHTENMYGLHKQALTKLEQAIGLLVLAESEDKRAGKDPTNSEANPTELPKVHVESAMVHHLLAHTQQAIHICENSLNRSISAVGDSHLQVADMHGKLGSLYMSMGTKAEMEKGKAHLNQALEIAGNKLSENDHTAAEVMATMGQLLLTEGQYEQAEKYLELSLKMTYSIFGTTSVHFAGVLGALALSRVGLKEVANDQAERQRRAADAAAAEEKSTRESAAAIDDDAPTSDERARFAAELAATTVETKMAEGFEPLDNELLNMEPLQMFDMVIKIRLSRQGAVHVEVATSYIHQADGYWVNGDFDKVVELYSHAIKIFKEIHGDESKQVAQLYGWTGVAHTYAGRWEESLDSIGQAMILVDKAFEMRDANGTRIRRGKRTWEYWRLKHDLIYVLKHATEGDSAGTPSSPVRTSTSAFGNVHSAFKGAEREEVQALELRKELVRENVSDEAVRMSILIAKRRLQLRRKKREEQRNRSASRGVIPTANKISSNSMGSPSARRQSSTKAWQGVKGTSKGSPKAAHFSSHDGVPSGPSHRVSRRHSARYESKDSCSTSERPLAGRMESAKTALKSGMQNLGSMSKGMNGSVKILPQDDLPQDHTEATSRD